MINAKDWIPETRLLLELACERRNEKGNMCLAPAAWKHRNILEMPSTAVGWLCDRCHMDELKENGP